VIDAALLRQLHAHEPRRFVFRFAIFAALYVSSAAGAIVWASPWAAPLYFVAAASLHGISLFTHEAVHGVLSRRRAVNHALGALCALPVLQNFAAYRVLHLRHHAHLGVEGDPDHYENYTRRRGLVYAMHWGRLLLGYPAYITAIPVLGFRQGTARDRLFVTAEVAALVAVAALAVAFVPGRWLLHGWLLPMALVNTLVNIRGMSQHTLLANASDVVRGTRTILGTPVSRFFMCNENFHLEHHLYPGVPWYHLPRLHAALRDELARSEAPYIPTYLRFVADFVRATLGGGARGTVTLR
jgi:fatty acid desaturase